MADFHEIAQQVADAAERVADVVDAAQGKGARSGGGAGRWLLLPAAGAVAGFVAARKGPSLMRQAKGLAEQAKEEAPSIDSDLDLIGRVKEFAGLDDEGAKGGGTSPTKRRETSSSAQKSSGR